MADLSNVEPLDVPDDPVSRACREAMYAALTLSFRDNVNEEEYVEDVEAIGRLLRLLKDYGDVGFETVWGLLIGLLAGIENTFAEVDDFFKASNVIAGMALTAEQTAAGVFPFPSNGDIENGFG